MSSLETVLFNCHPTIGHAISRLLNLGIRRPKFDIVILQNTSARPHECYISVLKDLPFWQIYKEVGIDLLGLNSSIETSRDYVTDKHGFFVFNKTFTSSEIEYVTLDMFDFFVINNQEITPIDTSNLSKSFILKVDPHIVVEHERSYGSKTSKNNGIIVEPINLSIIGWTSWWNPKVEIINKILTDLNIQISLPELDRKIDDFLRVHNDPVHTIPFIFAGCPRNTDNQKKVIANQYIPVDAKIILDGTHLTYLHVKYQQYEDLFDMLRVVKILIVKSLEMLYDEINTISNGVTISGDEHNLFLLTLIQFANFSYDISYGHLGETSVKTEHKDLLSSVIRGYIKMIQNS
jgi:hypothetical protein